MQRFQTMLLSLTFVIFLPMTLFAADEVDSKTSDTPTEAESAEKADDMIMLRQTQPITGFQPLTVAGQEINATFLEETLGEQHGAIIFFHDQGEELESLGVVTPLRHQLLEYGWSTLSVSLDYPFEPNITLAIPDAESADLTDETDKTESVDKQPENESKVADIEKSEVANKDEPASLPPISNQQRIDAALSFIQAKDIERIILLGHGTGGLVALEQLVSTAVPISALILVGTPALESDDEFKKLELPVFDLYGELDLAGVAEAVKHRKVVMKRTGNIMYTAREINGANHVFYGLEPMLTKTVRGWLHATFIKREESE